MARLRESELEDARAAAARLLVLGPRAHEALVAEVEEGVEPGPTRALRVLSQLEGEGRTLRVLSECLRSNSSEVRRLAAQLLAGSTHREAVRALEEGAREASGAIGVDILVSLHLLARGEVEGAGEAFTRVLKGLGTSPPTAEELLARADRLQGRLDLLAQDPLAEDDGEEAPPPAAGTNPLERYLELVPDSDEEVSRRTAVATSAGASEIAERLESQEDIGQLSLLCLLAMELADARLIPGLRRVVQFAQSRRVVTHDAALRAELIALSGRAHLALARSGSRGAAMELGQDLREIDPAELRVEHLRAVELVGSRTEIPALVPLVEVGGWLGDTAFRVLGEVMAREELSTRSTLLKGLSPARRKALRSSRRGG